MNLDSNILLLAMLLLALLITAGVITALVRRGMSERKPADRQHNLCEHLPWGALIAPGIMLNKNRTMMRTLTYRGPDLAASSDEEMMAVTARVNNALKRLETGWTLYIEAQRKAQNHYPDSSWKEKVSWLVDEERRGQFESADEHFESFYFITFVWERPQTLTKKLENLFYENPDKGTINDDFEHDLNYFEQATTDIANNLHATLPEVGWLHDDDLLSYLHSTISPKSHPVKAPQLPMYLDALLADKPFNVAECAMVGEHFVPSITVMDFPHETIPGILDELNHLSVEYRWSNRFICFDKGDSQKEILKKRKYWQGKVKGIWTLLKETAAGTESRLIDSDAQNKSEDADIAAQELGAGYVSYGHLTSTVSVWDTDIEKAYNKLNEVKKILNSNGFVVKDEKLYGFESWKGAIPGNIGANVRRPMINTLNLTHMMPISAIWAGENTNEHLLEIASEGNPHIICNTQGATPFKLNLNIGDVGHTIVIGPTGAGKSTLLCLLELQWLKYPDAQVFIFDKQRSSRAATMAVGGIMYEPGSENAAIAFQPLAKIDNDNERIWAMQFVCDILEQQSIEITPGITREIEGALKALSDSPKEQRTFTSLNSLCQNQTIRDALHLYTLDGAYGQLFDADHDDIGDSFWLMFEMEELMEMGDNAIVPALSYLFHRLEARFDGSPTLLVLDECWLFLDKPMFAARLKNWLKTLRKKHVYVIFATQEPADAARSSIKATILSACHTRIFLPDREALTPEVAEDYKTFGLSNTELGILSTATEKQDYYYRSTKGRRLFSMELGPVTLAFVGASAPEDQQFMDKIKEELAPENWAEALLEHRGLNWAAELIREEERRVA